RELVVNTIDEAAGDTLMTIAEQIEREVAEKYEQQLADMAKEKALANQEKELANQEKALANQEKELANQEKEILLKQLRDAGIDPDIHH
ncbi:MAG: hypothetical protein AAFZ92_11750, partial [Pseudomonadota bacterium]